MVENPLPEAAPVGAPQKSGCAPTLLAFVLLGWLALIPAGVMGLAALALPDMLPQLRGALATLVVAALLLPVYAVALLLTRRRAGWEGTHALAMLLLALSGYLLLDGAIRGFFPTHPNWVAAWRLALLTPYALAVGRLVASAKDSARSAEGAQQGLDLPTLWLTAALAALFTLPWAITGALGDSLASLGLVFQALGENLPLTLLLWGAGLALLRAHLSNSRAAALTVILLFALTIAGGVIPAGDWGALANALFLLPLGFLATEMVARGRSPLLALLLLVVLRAAPRLFIDPRDIEGQGIPELQHLFSHIGIWMAIAVSGPVLWALRVMFGSSKLAPRLRLVLSLAAAGLFVCAWLGAYLFLSASGFTNDGFLIILEEQADLSAAYAITDREARLGYVYDTLVATAERTQAPIRAELDRRGLSYRPYYLINMIRVDGATWQMRRFEELPGVAQVLRNPNVRMYEHRIAFPSYGADERPVPALQDNLAAINVAGAWDLGITGAGIVVAGQDTGYEWDHPALIRQYRGWDGATASHAYNWHDAWGDFDIPTDEDGHGTHTMGTVLGDDGDRNRTGVAPEAQWIGCRNMRRGLGNPASYAECMEFFLAPYPPGGDPFRDGDVRYAPHLTTNSWGCPEMEGCQPDTLEAGVIALRAAGIMSVVAAGNEGPACETASTPPSHYDASFTVGAVYSDGGNTITGFSSRGPAGELLKPDVVAPGYDVRSSFLRGTYAYAPGTSMATPHVAGLVALLWSANPALIGDIDATEALIRQTATPKPLRFACTPDEVSYTDPLGLSENSPICGCGGVIGAPNNVYGYGLIHVEAAVRAALGE